MQPSGSNELCASSKVSAGRQPSSDELHTDHGGQAADAQVAAAARRVALLMCSCVASPHRLPALPCMLPIVGDELEGTARSTVSCGNKGSDKINGGRPAAGQLLNYGGLKGHAGVDASSGRQGAQQW